MGVFRTPQQHPFADMVLTYAAELLWAFAVVARNHCFAGVSGERGWDRTIDLLIKSQLLYH
jgi:hypothetical protein